MKLHEKLDKTLEDQELMKSQIESMQIKVNAMQQQSTTTGEQVAEMYAVQAGDVVVKSELDAAYREGVNSYE